jgi:hypothetical protein
MKVNTSRLAAIVLGGLAVLWAFALFFGLPYLYSRKVDHLVGQPLLTVQEQLGPPTRQWETPTFACDPSLPCTGKPQGGPVLLYASRDQAWYLYFDGGNILRTLERSAP